MGALQIISSVVYKQLLGSNARNFLDLVKMVQKALLLIGFSLVFVSGRVDYLPMNDELMRMVEDDLDRAGIDRAEVFGSNVTTYGMEGAEAGSEPPKADEEFFQGDILVEKSVNGEGLEENAIKWGDSKWVGVIPYRFADGFPYKSVVRNAIEEYHEKTCIRFKEEKSGNNGIKFIKGKGCYSMVGKTTIQPQVLSIGNRCDRKGIVIHELMHALGFFHEQSRTDRDTYVKIVEENIQEGRINNFVKYGSETITDHGTSYDYCSIMHYGPTAFSKNGRITIRVLQNDGDCEIGQRSGFSKTDLEKLRKMYKCPCTGGNDCCTKTNPCNENEGDCDKDEDCKGELKCGDDNCPGRKFFCFSESCYSKTDDCCVQAGEIY